MENNLIQGSDEWFKIRLGKFTSSEIHRLLPEPKSKKEVLSKTAINYVLEKVHESLTGEFNSFDSEATAWGVQNEHLARKWYEKIKGVEVKEIGFTKVSDDFGGSADGLVGDEGGIEIKCPYNGANHLKHCMIYSQDYFKENFKEYYWQCVCNCYINGGEWWDFVSFDPRINLEIGFFCFRIYPTPEEYQFISEKVEKAIIMKNDLINKFTHFFRA